ncbi:MAG: hypothetical protein COA43_12595 [Robiginitomaculum sp.]|nr:MAG: hypothetical protein COA43_12595 [Robiginitomaculum sp.]
MFNLRVKLLGVLTLLYVLITACIYHYINADKVNKMTEFEYNNLDAQAKIMGQWINKQGGCTQPSPDLHFNEFTAESFFVSGIAYRVICKNNGFSIETYAFPKLDNIDGFLDTYEDEEGDGWFVLERNLNNGKFIIALKERSTGVWFIETSTLVMVILMPFFVMVVLYFSIAFLLRPLNQLTNVVVSSPDTLENLNVAPELAQIKAAFLKLRNEQTHTLSIKKIALKNERSFTANAAHELLTPLAAIKAEVQLQQRLTEDETLYDGLSEILLRANRAIKTVDQLITLGRLEPGHKPKNISPINLNIMINDILDDLRLDIKTQNFQITTSLPQDHIIIASAVLIDTLLRNLLQNTINYTPYGRGIEIISREENNAIYLAIANDCNELPEYLTDHIFDRFVRGPHESETGSGLGLSIAQKIALVHDTQLVHSVSKNRKYITFSIRLPDGNAVEAG